MLMFLIVLYASPKNSCKFVPQRVLQFIKMQNIIPIPQSIDKHNEIIFLLPIYIPEGSMDFVLYLSNTFACYTIQGTYCFKCFAFRPKRKYLYCSFVSSGKNTTNVR